SRNVGSVINVPRSDRTITGDALGFFLALIPTVPTTASFQNLLREAGAGTIWLDTSARSTDSEDTGVASLGLHDEEVVFLTATFLGTMLNSATANPEREMLFSLLADMSDSYPRVIAQIYESIQERVIDAFSNVMNSTILSSVGAIFRTSMGDGGYQTMPSTRMDASASTLGNLESSGNATQGAGQQQIMYLETLQMRGMLIPHHFTPRNTGTKILHCLIELISRII
ncbi:11488_t:CDS:2, partial [Acaulospora colombiana]